MLSPLCNNKCYINTLFALLHSDHNCDVLQRWYCGGDGGGPTTGLHAVCVQLMCCVEGMAASAQWQWVQTDSDALHLHLSHTDITSDIF